MILTNNCKLVMIGDSVTDCNRLRPIGEGNITAHGNGYVNLVNAFLNVFYPDKMIRVVNMGISGNTVRDLKARWDSDVLKLQPDYVSIMIGVNDVWHQLDRPHQIEDHVDITEYEETLEYLIKNTEGVKKIILISPFIIEKNNSDKMRLMLDEYQKVMHKLADKYSAIYVDVQKDFDELLNHYHSSFFAWDRVHPNNSGHLVIARSFLNAIGFEWKPIK